LGLKAVTSRKPQAASLKTVTSYKLQAACYTKTTTAVDLRLETCRLRLSYKEQILARFEELDVWKRAARLSADIYKEMAEHKDYGFRDQITRAGLSIPSNIAEGNERNSDKELTLFLNYAKGSAGELRTQIYIGMEIGYINRDTGKSWLTEAEEISKMLHGLIRSILKAATSRKPQAAS
jgi:four helix bundle protein